MLKPPVYQAGGFMCAHFHSTGAAIIWQQVSALRKIILPICRKNYAHWISQGLLRTNTTHFIFVGYMSKKSIIQYYYFKILLIKVIQ
jgi:hypothetical protein